MHYHKIRKYRIGDLHVELNQIKERTDLPGQVYNAIDDLSAVMLSYNVHPSDD